MSRYYDTGVLLKLYTEEEGSDRVRSFVTRRREALIFTPLHRAECVSALRLKAFRGECQEDQSTSALADIDADVASGVLRRTAMDWEEAWERAGVLARDHAATTGCRTLDSLHVACALQLGVTEMVTRDARQSELACRAGLKVANPLR